MIDEVASPDATLLAAPPHPATIDDAFRQVARLHPGSPALLWHGGSMTYAELDARSDGLARLVRAHADEGAFVGLCVERGPALVVGMLGILKAGRAYVPLDPAYPEARLRFMLEDSRAQVVVVDAETRERLPAGPRTLLRWDAPCSEGAPSRLAASADAPAYVCYTSGSTGRPKGAIVPHRGVLRLVRGATYAALGPEETILQLASPSFDATTFEVWAALLNGGRLAFPRSARPRLDELGAELRAHGVTTLWLTAGLFHLMVDERLEDLRPLRQLLAGGDVLCPRRVRRVLQTLPHLRLVNGYGPTENTTFTTCHTARLEDVTDRVPIGRPIERTYVRVLDEAGRPVAPGDPGELYAGGDGLALGYLNLPELTAERFVDDPLRPGARLYRTGDLVRARPDGALEFLGRTDDQVKIRGVRVEPDEVAAAVRTLPGVRDAVVVARRDHDDVQLVAYVLPLAGASADEATVLAHLRSQLPEPLLPSRVVTLDAFPLNGNGKVDRGALPAPDLARAPAGRSPRGPAEEAIARAWREVLRVDRVDADDDFLRLGGHSLKAAQVAARLSDALGQDVGVADVLEARTVAGLAARLAGRPRGERGDLARRVEQAPLSALQAQLWIVERLVPERQVYLVPYEARLRGPVDAAALERALSRLEARHAALRLRWLEEDGAVVGQRVAPPAPADLPLHDLSALDAERRAAALAEVTARAASQPLDLRGRPWRAALVRLDAREHVLLWTLHHLVTDGWSMTVLFRELASLYAQEIGADAPALPAAGHEFLAWCEAQARAQPDDARLAYWRQALGGRLPVLELPTDRPRPRRASAAGGAVALSLPPALVARLRAVATAEGVTPFTALLAAFQALLGRCSRADDVAVVVPHANREAPGLDRAVGLFVDMLPVRVSLDGAPTFRELLGRVRAASLGALEHAVPFSRLLAQLTVDRSDGAGAAFQAMFALLDVSDLPTTLGDVPLDVRLLPNGGAKCDLSLLLEERAGGEVAGALEYRVDLFERASAERLARHYLTLLEAALADPATPVAALPLLTPPEREEIVVAWNQTRAPAPTGRLLHQLFEARVDEAPDALAVTDGARRWSYGELEARANQVAHRLREAGVERGARVAICVERSLELVAAILGVLKAGAAYVPLDPDHPPERLEFMLGDLAAPVLLTQRCLLARLPAGQRAVCLDDLDGAATTRPPCTSAVDDVAYVIYTSGSTGRPKGVVVRHRPALNVLDWVNATFGVGPGDRLLFVTSPCFDLSVYDVLGVLAAGASLHVASHALLRDPARLAALLDDGSITLWDSAPPALAQLEPWLPVGSTTGRLRLCLLSGDWIPVTLPDRLRRAWPGLEVVSLGGATEATIWSNYYRIGDVDPAWPSIPYGRPIRNARYHVLDAHMQPVPINVAGELWIGGDCLADGYLNRPELTAERFVPDPFAPGGRLYRTGDLARYRADGALELLGRIDCQVKVRGHRIELGEVEAALSHVEGVAACAVAARGDRGAERALVGYVVPRRPDLDPQAVRAALAERLPAPMVPAQVVLIDALPLTPNGKLDRAALPAPVAATSEAAAPPRDPLEAELAAAFAAALDVERVGVHDDFFALGGHSLAAARAVAEIRRRTGVELPLPRFFAAPTVAGLRAEVARLGAEGGATTIPGLPRDGRRAWPMTSAQRRLWFLERLHGGSPRYTVGVAVEVEGPLDVDALRAALDGLVARHEALRTTFSEEERGTPVQVIAAAGHLDLPLDDLSSEPDPFGAADAIAAREAAGTFDPRVSCTRARLLRLAPERHRLVLAQHHLVTDAASIGVLLRDLGALYEGGALPPVPVQPADFAAWEEAWLASDEARAQLDAWRERLAGAPPVQALPTDLPRPSAPSLRGERRRLELPTDAVARVLGLARAEGATPFVALLAAFAVLLHRRGGDPCVVINAPVTARRRPELMGAAGFFVNTLPLAVDLAGEPSFRAVLARAKAAVLDAFARPDVPLDRLVEALRPAREGGAAPFQQVLFMESSAAERVAAGGLSFTATTLPNGGAKYDLLLDVSRDERGAGATLEFAADLLTLPAADRLLGHLAQLLEEVGRRPDAPISTLELLTPAERELLGEWNATARDFPRDRCVHELLAELAAREPERTAVALAWEEGGAVRTLDYGALVGRAQRLARALRRAGVGRDVPVGVFLERSPELVIGLVAALEAGGAYLPLDPGYPAERVAFMLEDAAAPVVITTAALAGRLPAGRHRVVLVEDPEAGLDAAPAAPPPAAATPDSLAYIIYTSGSTGAPKGVAVTHRAVVRLVRGADYIAFGPDQTHLLLAPVSFDASTFELWGALLNGARLAIAPPGRVGLDEIGRAVRRLGVTTLWLTAGLFQTIVDERLDDLGPLRQLVTGGDVVSPAHAARVLERHPHLRLVNGYGPTECTTFACCHTVRREDVASGAPLPIGGPIANTRAYVVDRRGRLLPVGDAGELWLGGDGVARGYVARPELTAQRFLDDPFAPGGRVYRTGDLARWRPDGRLEFLGRLDRQVKIRGHRVEPGELEGALGQHPAVREAAVVVQDGPGGKALQAFVVPEPDVAVDAAALLRWLQTRVPAYLLPVRVVGVASLPLDPNGKVDRSALLALDQAPSRTHRPPRDEAERALAAIWQALLQVDQVGLDDDFFALGGHSLLALRLSARVEAELNHALPIARIFAASTLEAMASVVRRREGATGLVVTLDPRGQGAPLFVLPGIGGHPFTFRPLAQQLGGARPVHGLLGIGLDGKEPCPSSVGEIADRYVEELLRVQASGPYSLVGYSFGGVVAYEVAVRLRRRGEEVRLVALVDCPAPGYPAKRPLHERARVHWENLVSRSGLDRLRYVAGRTRNLLRRIGLRVRVPLPQEAPAAADGTVAARIAAVRDAQFRALERHRATPGLDAPLLVLRAAHAPPDPHRGHLVPDDDPLLGWGAYADGPARFATVPGAHLELFAPGNVEAIVDALRAALA
ncbi:MAG: amino acid adenylation domain-containing protein [Planctomycetes bacterium]|nr:amino acid adenylation domain-containing protein [Planctomycetota bacterium]